MGYEDSPAWTEEAASAWARFDPRPSLGRRLAAPPLTAACRLLMQGLNRVVVGGRERLEQVRGAGRGLLTFSNHVSLFDDPWLIACISAPDWHHHRWVAADALNFFNTEAKARFFGAGKGVPIVRGAGIDQPGMNFLADRLAAGEWVHVFPEGGRSRNPAQLATPLKTGMAHLVQASRPLLLPFHHTGMERILPIGAHVPRLFHKVNVRFGEVTDSAEGLAGRTVQEITDWAEGQLQAFYGPSRVSSFKAA
jgi:monolysocardiolipin acyltransferase